METITTIKGSRNHLKNCCTSLFVGGGELENPEQNPWYKVRTNSKLKPHDNSPHCCEVSVLTTASSTLFSYNQVNNATLQKQIKLRIKRKSLSLDEDCEIAFLIQGNNTVRSRMFS